MHRLDARSLPNSRELSRFFVRCPRMPSCGPAYSSGQGGSLMESIGFAEISIFRGATGGEKFGVMCCAATGKSRRGMRLRHDSRPSALFPTPIPYETKKREVSSLALHPCDDRRSATCFLLRNRQRRSAKGNARFEESSFQTGFRNNRSGTRFDRPSDWEQCRDGSGNGSNACPDECDARHEWIAATHSGRFLQGSFQGSPALIAHPTLMHWVPAPLQLSPAPPVPSA